MPDNDFRCGMCCGMWGEHIPHIPHARAVSSPRPTIPPSDRDSLRGTEEPPTT
ncbi:MAG: hypothetical protein HMLKMBBP_01093 [Planctomycetes bacterium]|nr:hypothetical protein [Planctomycetota bacterium]